MARIADVRIREVRRLYDVKGWSMREIGEYFGVSLDAVTYFMRKHDIARRTTTESNRVQFERKSPSFIVRRSCSVHARDMSLIGAMLYWAEGHKRDTANGIDFANSDPDMAFLFFHFMKTRYILDQERLYFSVYHYSDQDLDAITRFWAKKLGVPVSAFRNSYKNMNPNMCARKLPYGVLHIRYNDKKILRDMLNLIEFYKSSYCVGGGAVNRTRL